MPRGFRGGEQRARAVARLIERDGDHCWYCGFTFSDGERACTIDHVVPVSERGTNRLENIRLACFRCNMQRACTPTDVFERSEFLARRRWHAYRTHMVDSGRWLPKRAFNHEGIRWHGEGDWECGGCGQSTATRGCTPAVVPCAPWCDQQGAEWVRWWRGARVAPTGWPNDRPASHAEAPAAETHGETRDSSDTLTRSPLAALLLTKGDARRPPEHG